jgi:opacity protein-like surface antigen
VASTGRNPYLDSSYDLNYRHKFSSKLSFDLGGRIGASDYTSGNAATSLRNDFMYSIATGVKYAFNTHLSADLNYSVDLGRNMQDNIVNPQNREFNHHLVSLGLQLKF